MKSILNVFVKTIIAVAVLTVVVSCATANKTENTAVMDITEGAVVENTVTITGRVVIFGSEPNIFAGIVSEDGKQYAIYPPEKENELRGLQGYLIRFTVVFIKEPVQSLGSLSLKGGTVTPVAWEVVR